MELSFSEIDVICGFTFSLQSRKIYVSVIFNIIYVSVSLTLLKNLVCVQIRDENRLFIILFSCILLHFSAFLIISFFLLVPGNVIGIRIG